MNESDLFANLEKEFTHVELPPDPAERIVKSAETPIQAAMLVYDLVQEAGSNEGADMLLRSVADKANARFSEFLGRNTLTISDLVYASPVPQGDNEAQPGVSIYVNHIMKTYGVYDGVFPMMLQSRNEDDSISVHPGIAVKLSEPKIFSEDGSQDNAEEPTSYVLVPVHRVAQYGFEQ